MGAKRFGGLMGGHIGVSIHAPVMGANAELADF